MPFVMPLQTTAANLQVGSDVYQLESDLAEAYRGFGDEKNHHHNGFFRHSGNCHRWMPVHLWRDVSRGLQVRIAEISGSNRFVGRLHGIDQALDE